MAILGLLAAPRGLAAQSGGDSFTVGHYDLEVKLDPSVHMLRARARMKLVAFEPLNTVKLFLNHNLRVDKVSGAKGRRLGFERTTRATSFTVSLGQTIRKDETFTITVEYSGAFDPALTGDGDPVLAMISPEVTYLLPDARWFPRSENLWQRYAMDLKVTAPKGDTVISSGKAGATAPAGAGKTRHSFRSSTPSNGGVVVAGRYDVTRHGESVPVRYYLRTVSSSYAASNSDRVGEILAFFSDEFGALENPEVSIIEIPDDTLEAYAAPGLLLLPTRQWREEISYRLLARHLAAQWWRVAVAPAGPSDAWLADGLSRYSEALYANEAEGEDGFRQALEDMTIGALVDESVAAIGNSDRLEPFSPEYDSVVRDKGAMVFHMLRTVMGEEKFRELLQAYLTRFAGRSLTIDQFERFAEETGGEPLDYFFGQWVRSTGIPQFELEYVIFRTRKGFRVNGAVKNTLEIFRMPVEIRVNTEGPPHSQTVDVTGTSSEFEFETFGKPLPPIRIDPDLDVLKYTPDLRVRVAIARGEAMFERGDYFEAVREYQEAIKIKRDSSLAHYRLGETFFHQRNYQSAANAFREAESGDREPLWTKVWSHINLGKIFDITGQRERAVNEYRKALATKDDTSGAPAEARRYLRDPFKRESREIRSVENIRRQDKTLQQNEPEEETGDDAGDADEDAEPEEEKPPADEAPDKN